MMKYIFTGIFILFCIYFNFSVESKIIDFLFYNYVLFPGLGVIIYSFFDYYF